MRRIAAALWLALLPAACGRAEPEPKQYELTGQILALAPERREVTIRHEDIEGFMPAMTMPFIVEDAALLDGRQPGDLVTATLVVGETSAHLSVLTTTGHAPIEDPPAPGGALILRPGDPVTDAAFLDQDGAPRTLRDFQGHRVALTFIYTRCPLPDFCPLMNRHFAALQKAITSDRALADVRLVTVTLDPAYDTPPVLKAHARVFDADPARWSFLTGAPEDLSAFATQFGIYLEVDPKDPSQIAHNLRTIVIGPDNRVVTTHTGNDWTPSDLLADLATAAPSTH
jgi:protein SCO1/2